MKKETKKIIQGLGWILFAVYVLLLTYFLFFSEGYGRTGGTGETYRYNLIPFVEIRRFWIYRDSLGSVALYTNIFGNIIGFLPFGFILPIVTHRMRSGFVIIMSGFALSLTVELIQLVTRVGIFDVDDLILNTLGAAIGYLFFVICDYFRRNYYGKKI